MRKKTTKNFFVACEKQSFDRREGDFNSFSQIKKKSELEKVLFFVNDNSFPSLIIETSSLHRMISIQDNQYTSACVYTQLYHQFIPKYDLYKAGQVEGGGGGNSVEVLFDSVGSLVSMVGLSSPSPSSI